MEIMIITRSIRILRTKAAIIAAVFSVLLCYSNFLSAQDYKRCYNWYFGNNAGLNFSSGSPVNSLGSAMTSYEGTTAISDAAGNLLFYTNGEQIWNRNHSPMTNGTLIQSCQSSFQSGIVVPDPGNASKYYLFGVDCFENLYKGLFYSIIDMTLSAGNGAVTATKEVNLVGNTFEIVTATKHANGTDYWVVTHTQASASFYAFCVSSTGIAAPIISNVGITVADNSQLKISPDATKIATVSWICNFNNSTGVISNPLPTGIPEGDFGAGVSFSGDSKYLYVNRSSNQRIYQLDVTVANPISTSVVVGTYTEMFAQFALAPNGKIYISFGFDRTFLGVINCPNDPGVACNYVHNGPAITGNTSGESIPNFVDYWLQNNTLCLPLLPIELISFTGACEKNNVLLHWSTAVETNNDYFTIERSANGNLWETIGTVDGAGNSFTTLNYEFIDSSPLPFAPSQSSSVAQGGEGLYRLKQIDFDGKFEYFAPVAVNCHTEQSEVSISPNPAGNELNISFFSETEDEIIIEAYNVLGQLVVSKSSSVVKGNNLFTLDISSAASGMYMLNVRTSGWNRNRKIIKSVCR